MNFVEAHVLPFTGEHQPSLVKSAARIAAAAKRKEARIVASRLAPSRVTNTLSSVTKLKNRSNFKIAAATRVRGVVVCNTCFRPRCIYSQYAVVHMKPPLEENDQDPATPTSKEVKQYKAFAKDRLDDATESLIYMCGMAPLDPDDPCFDIFQCDPSLDCDTHIESELYISKISPTRVKICCHCAGKYDSPVELNTALKAPDGSYSVVLPIC
jgi:hypothetical protein